MPLSWTTQYYDAVEYYFWGPDKLNARRKAGQEGSAVLVLNRLKRIEEPLNHLLTLFLDLSPDALRRELALSSGGLDIGAGSSVGVRSTSSLFGTTNVVQPDALISGPAGIIALEVKLGSKSNFNQVLKYALLLSRLSHDRPFALCYLTQNPFRWHWDSCDTPEVVKAAASSHLEGLERIGGLRIDDAVRAEISDALAKLQLTAWGFAELGQLLEHWLERPIQTHGDETLHKLCGGMLIELQVRGLVCGQSRSA
jgi:hypothetical protein